MKRHRTILFIILIISTISLTSFGQQRKTVIVNGIGSDREAAIRDAQRQAIESVVGVYLTSETIVENFTLLKEEIYTKTKGYVSSQQILNERADIYGYSVTMEITVSTEKIEKDLAAIGLLLQQKGNPRVIVIINEYAPIRSPYPIAETAIADYLLDKEFKIVDPERIKVVRSTNRVKALLEGDYTKAAVLGTELGADVLIVGTARSRRDYKKIAGDLYRAKADVKVRAILRDTGELIATANKRINGIGETIDEAYEKSLENAGKKVAQSLMKKILKRWKTDVYFGNQIQITIANVDSFAALSTFEQGMRRKIGGVTSVVRRSYERNVAILDVNFRGTAGLLSNLLEERELGIEFEVTGSSQNRVEVRFSDN